jgi:hypothetical protein
MAVLGILVDLRSKLMAVFGHLSHNVIELFLTKSWQWNSAIHLRQEKLNSRMA